MSAVSLNARIGLLFDEKSLAAVEKRLRYTGKQLSQIGGELSLSLSAPLAAFGAASIKAAGDIEGLTLALKSQLGTAEAAQKELELLTAAAKNPGLGVEQAVRGSVRLQGVGLAAEDARKVLVQMGNAIAATGGSAQELDNVTRQFAQIISKGRVLQEDVSILSENMPGLAQLMQKAFGTQSVEAIRAMGVSGQDFVLAITAAAEELPRVEGGIKNGIGNALDSLKQSAAKVGLAINTAFNVTGAIESFTAGLLSLAEGFAALPEGAQKVILALGGIAIAAGPVLKVIGNMKLLGAELAGVWRAMVGAIGSAVTAFKAMDAAMKATVIGAVVAGVLLLVSAYNQFSHSLSAAQQAQIAVNDVTKAAAASISAEKVRVETLVGVLKDNTASLQDKKAALEQLQKISPQYFGNLDLEKGKVEGLTVAVSNYTRALEKQAIVKQATDEIARLTTQLNDLGDAADPTLLQQAGNALQSLALGPLAGKLAFEQLNEQTRVFNEQDIRAATAAKIEALRKLVKENLDLSSATQGATQATNSYQSAVSSASNSAKTYANVLKEIGDAVETAKLLGDDVDAAKVDALRKGVEQLIQEGFKPASAEVQNLKNQLDALSKSPILIDIIRPKPVTQPVLPTTPTQPPTPPGVVTGEKTDEEIRAEKILEIQNSLKEGTASFAEVFRATESIVSESGSVMQNVFLGMASAIQSAAASGEASLKSLALTAASAGLKIVRSYIQQGVAAAVAKALQSIPFPLNIAAGAAAGALAAGLFTRFVSSIGIKGFARGTQNFGGGLAVVGEAGPEVVSMPRRSKIFNASQSRDILSGGNATPQPIIIGGEIRFNGRDLFLIVEKQNDFAKRTRGGGIS